MTDEMNIQQRPSALPYAGTGAAIGALGGYYGLPKIDAVKKFVSEPAKYSSYEEIINEADDKFTKALGEAEGEEKTLMEKARDARQAGVDAGKKYDADLEAYKNANKAGEAPQLASDHEAMKAYDAKRKELIEKEVEKLKQNAPKENVANEKAVNALKEKIATAEKVLAEETKSVNEVIETFANRRYETLEKFNGNSRSKGFRKQFESMLEKQDQKLVDYINSLKGLSEAQKKTLLEQARTVIDNRLAIAELEHATVPEFAFGNVKKNAETLLNDYANKLSEKNKGLKDNIAKYLADPGSEANRTNMKRILDSEKAKLQKVQNFQTTFQEFIKNGTPEEVKKVITVKGNGYVSKLMFPTLEIEITEQSSEAAKKFKTVWDGLSKEEKASIQRLVGENPTVESLEANIKDLEANIKTLESATTRLNNLQAEITKVAGEGAYIKDGKLFNKAGQEVKAKMTIPSNLETSVTVPESRQLSGLRKSLASAQGTPITTMTNEQLAEQAAKNIDAKAGELLKAEQDAINSAREALPKNANKTTEQLTEEFIKKNGKREDVVKKAQEGFKDDVKKLFEGKIKNGKLAAVVAGTAVAGALLGLAFRPSSNEA